MRDEFGDRIKPSKKPVVAFSWQRALPALIGLAIAVGLIITVFVFMIK